MCDARMIAATTEVAPSRGTGAKPVRSTKRNRAFCKTSTHPSLGLSVFFLSFLHTREESLGPCRVWVNPAQPPSVSRCARMRSPLPFPCVPDGLLPRSCSFDLHEQVGTLSSSHRHPSFGFSVFCLLKRKMCVFFLSTWTVIDPRLVLSVFVEKLASMGVTDGGGGLHRRRRGCAQGSGRAPSASWTAAWRTNSHKTLSQLGCHTIPSDSSKCTALTLLRATPGPCRPPAPTVPRAQTTAETTQTGDRGRHV